MSLKKVCDSLSSLSHMGTLSGTTNSSFRKNELPLFCDSRHFCGPFLGQILHCWSWILTRQSGSMLIFRPRARFSDVSYRLSSCEARRALIGCSFRRMRSTVLHAKLEEMIVLYLQLSKSFILLTPDVVCRFPRQSCHVEKWSYCGLNQHSQALHTGTACHSVTSTDEPISSERWPGIRAWKSKQFTKSAEKSHHRLRGCTRKSCKHVRERQGWDSAWHL